MLCACKTSEHKAVAGGHIHDFVLSSHSGVRLNLGFLPDACWVEVLRGGCPFTRAFPPEDNVNPCLSQSSHLGFSSVLSGASCLLFLSLEAGFNVDPASGFCYPSLDTQWLLLDARLFSTLRDVLIVRRKSRPESNFIQIDSVIYLVLIQGQDIEVFTWI